MANPPHLPMSTLMELSPESLFLHLEERFRHDASQHRKAMDSAPDSFQRETSMRLAEQCEIYADYVDVTRRPYSKFRK